ncbi:hypothetical protein CDD81_4951 [Ophiocordyceps australis]|uniref:Exportin-1/Importin-beta-like domain-containing protein n=1 Tax=Ophiocordyceps australis TaxID=1399860 RepID=A0A2C5X6X6_9HYPO|nr:hypothetical protein CDD81_4951 [Ophiocordyceps australis]
MQEQAPVHWDLEQVEDMILSLYRPTSAHVISTNQAHLSQFQASAEAWSMIQHLLERPDDKVRFFGALTLIIKLNRESSSLGQDDARELLVRLMDWYLNSLTRASGPLVTRKLSSAIATHFVHFHGVWPRFVRHVTYCLAFCQSYEAFAVHELSADTAAKMPSLNAPQLQAALWVTTSVIEDVCKLDLNSISSIGLYDTILVNTTDAVTLMADALSAHPAIHGDSIACLQSWVCFALKAPGAHAGMAESLSPLIQTIISSLTNEACFDASVELLVDILSDYPSLMSEPHYEYLSNLFVTPWAKSRFQRLLRVDSDFESFLFGQLLLAFGEARAESLMQSCDAHSQQLLSILCGLLTAAGYPVTQDKIFVTAIEFWSTFAENVAGWNPPSDSESGTCLWTQMAVSHVLEAVSRSWRKIAFPPASEFSQWDANDRLGFIDARKDVVDLLQSAFALIGSRLVETFAELIASSLSHSEWLSVEAAIFCLGGLADCCRDDAACDKALASVFASRLFSLPCAGSSSTGFQARQACLHLIEQYTDFFERNVTFIPPALHFLFALLGERSAALSASKSILKLCSSCRNQLYSEVEALLDEYTSVVNAQELDCVSAERMAGALASVAQAVPTLNRRYSACAQIIRSIELDVQRALRLMASHKDHETSCLDLTCRKAASEDNPGLHACLRALSCLASAAKGFQSPCDTLIDLDASYDAQSSPCGNELTLLQHQILNIITKLQSAFGKEAEVMELICSILRCGFAESSPGPFVLEPDVVARYLTSHTSPCIRAGLFVSTACSFVNSPRCSPQSHEWQSILSSLLLWVITMLKQLPVPEDDPELAQNGIEFASLILAKTPRTLLGLQPAGAAEFLFMFNISVLDGREPLPKSAAAEFWATFVGFRGDDDVGLRQMINDSMATLGPLLCQSLARNLGGNASRSELVKLSEPVKKLICRHRMAKEWLLSGLNHSSFPSIKVSSEQKAIFVKRLLSLRGSRTTTQVIRDFWLSARGSNFAYVS